MGTVHKWALRLRLEPQLILIAFLLAVSIAIGAGQHASRPAKAAPPPDFQSSLVVGSGLDGPSGFEIAPDGRIFILERTGKIKIYKNGQLLATPFATLSSVASGDRGLIGIDFDPDFGKTNYWVYFYYTGTDLLNRVVRFDAAGDVGTNGPFTIFETQSPSQELHVGGSVQFGPDGKLYFAVGDNGYPPNGQDLSNPHGKILRINKDGSVPTDNPFYGQAGKLSAIWAYGFRNPWRFQFDPANGAIYGADVGDYTWEEINKIVKGGNYGWPLAEGMCTANCAGLINPIHTYNHNGQSAAVTGGPVYRGSMFPAAYQGSLFFGDYAQGFIKRLTLDAAGNATGVHDFDLNAGSVVDMKVAPDGSMYYITYYPGRMYRVTYNTANHAPTANATADVTKGLEPLTVKFSSAGSSDPDGQPLTYSWDFGDGTKSSEANPTKVYPNKGTYTVELTVSDGTNTARAVPIVIQVGTPPEVTIGAPADGTKYKAGDSITVNAHAVDAAGGDINDAAIKTDVIFHHDTHTHPFLDDLTGRANTFTIPDVGEAAANTWYEIKVTATDTTGLSSTKSVNIYPVTVDVTYATSPSGLGLKLDGVPITTPHTTKQVVNFKREISAPATQTGADGVVYQFDHWSDGGAIQHFATTPATATTFTAVYKPAGNFRGEYFANQTLAGTPAVVRDDPQINFVWGAGSPDPRIPAEHFSARWTKRQYFAAGRYKFTTATDDGVRFYIDGNLVIDKWVDQGTTAWSYVTDLVAGEHDIKMEYYDNIYDATARLTWEATPDQATPPSTTGWRGSYYGNKTLAGDPKLVRGDAAIDFDWGLGTPDPSVPADQFSVRWIRTQSFESATYRFTTTSDDGVRIYLDDELILDQWNDHGPTTFTVDKAITAGNHDIKVEYYENSHGAVAKFAVEKMAGAPAPETGYEAQYFNNQTLYGVPTLTRKDTAVNFDWGLSAPAPALPADHFSARWTKTEPLAAGTYQFSVTGDDGVRLYIDGVRVLDKWINQSPTTYTVMRNLEAGNHTIVLEYYENTHGAVAKLSYAKSGELIPPPEYSAEYFANQTLSGTPAVTRSHTQVDFDWGGGSPDASIPADHFSARWTKKDTYDAGRYEFKLTADDGIRLYIDGVKVLDKWIDQPATTHSIIQELTAGEHTIVIEYYENTHDAVARVGITRLP